MLLPLTSCHDYPTGVSYNAGAYGFTYNPATDSFWLRVDLGCNQYNSVMGEVGYATPLTGVECVRTQAHGGPVSSCTTDLNEGAVIQFPNFVMDGKAELADFVALPTGTASVSGTTVTGSGTAFLSELAVGSLVKSDLGGGSFSYYYVTAVASDTVATADRISSGTIAGRTVGPFCGGTSGCLLRGIYFPGDGNMYVNGYVNYDGSLTGAGSLYKITGYATLPPATVTGPMQLNVGGNYNAVNGGYAGGYLAHVPSTWQSPLGGDTIASAWNMSINSRASWGPPAFSFNISDAAAGPAFTSPISGTVLMAYSITHPTLGTPQEIDVTSQTQWTDFGAIVASAGIAVIDGSSTMVVVNAHTDNPCYGSPTATLALDRTPDPDGNSYCYTAGNQGSQLFSSKGDLADLAPMSDAQIHYPTIRMLFYDLNDLAAVKAGAPAYGVVPYDYWDVSFSQFTDYSVHGLAWDPSRQYLYLVTEQGDALGCCYNAPIIQVLHVIGLSPEPTSLTTLFHAPSWPSPRKTRTHWATYPVSIPLWPLSLAMLGAAMVARKPS